MMSEKIIRAVAGTLILTSIILSLTVSLKWLWLGGFVGFNLLQSSFTGFCPLEYFLKKGK
ncbi:MAG: DUF2892 domain-containing protein [Paludibacter sp.]|nr:DUF2892 domain-containing protein [Paludibacter sp.]